MCRALAISTPPMLGTYNAENMQILCVRSVDGAFVCLAIISLSH